MENNIIVLNGVQFPECTDLQISRQITTGQRVIPVKGEKISTLESKYTFVISWDVLDEEYMEQMNAIFNSPAGIMLTCKDDYAVDGLFNQKKVVLTNIVTTSKSTGTGVTIHLQEIEKVTGIRY